MHAGWMCYIIEIITACALHSIYLPMHTNMQTDKHADDTFVGEVEWWG